MNDNDIPFLHQSQFYKDVQEKHISKKILDQDIDLNELQNLVYKTVGKYPPNPSDDILTVDTRITIVGVYAPEGEEATSTITSILYDEEKLDRQFEFDAHQQALLLPELMCPGEPYDPSDQLTHLLHGLRSHAATQLNVKSNHARTPEEYDSLLVNEIILKCLVTMIFDNPLDFAIGLIIDRKIIGHYTLGLIWARSRSQ